MWITNADIADIFLVMANANPEAVSGYFTNHGMGIIHYTGKLAILQNIALIFHSILQYSIPMVR